MLHFGWEKPSYQTQPALPCNVTIPSLLEVFVLWVFQGSFSQPRPWQVPWTHLPQFLPLKARTCGSAQKGPISQH